MPVLGIIEAVGAIGGLATGVKSLSAAHKAAKRQQTLNRIKQKQETIQQIREARIRRAAVVAAGYDQGVGTSSGVVGGASSVESQLSGNLSFLDQVGNLQASIGKAASTANLYAGISDLFGAVGKTAAKADTAYTTQAAAGIPKDQQTSGTFFDLFR